MILLFAGAGSEPRAMEARVAELERFIVERAKLWLDGGTIFGADGAGFQRFNIATPRKILQQALDRLETAVRLIS